MKTFNPIVSVDSLVCIERFFEITQTGNFILHSKKFARSLTAGIERLYSEREDNIVKIIESIINSVETIETLDRNFKISTSSIFIHGNKSQVKFEYYGKTAQRELGDIIFILSVLYKGEKYFEKMTINQVKKSEDESWKFYKDGEKEQLYLLSRFPTFRGVKNKSLIPPKEYNLTDFSSCLGSYGLLYPPGEFAFISSKLLGILASEHNSVKLSNLVLDNSFYDFPLLYRYLSYYDYRFFYWKYCPIFYYLPIYRSSYMSYNAYEFSCHYLKGLIGELIYSKDLPFNASASQFLQDLIRAMRLKAKKEDNEELMKFVTSYYSTVNGGNRGSDVVGEFDYEYGGIGIIWTVIDLGE